MERYIPHDYCNEVSRSRLELALPPTVSEPDQWLTEQDHRSVKSAEPRRAICRVAVQSHPARPSDDPAIIAKYVVVRGILNGTSEDTIIDSVSSSEAEAI